MTSYSSFYAAIIHGRAIYLTALRLEGLSGVVFFAHTQQSTRVSTLIGGIRESNSNLILYSAACRLYIEAQQHKHFTRTFRDSAIPD